MYETHGQAADQHELAAHAHRTAAEHDENRKNELGNRHFQRGLEYSEHAYKLENSWRLGKQRCHSRSTFSFLPRDGFRQHKGHQYCPRQKRKCWQRTSYDAVPRERPCLVQDAQQSGYVCNCANHAKVAQPAREYRSSASVRKYCQADHQYLNHCWGSNHNLGYKRQIIERLD